MIANNRIAYAPHKGINLMKSMNGYTEAEADTNAHDKIQNMQLKTLYYNRYLNSRSLQFNANNLMLCLFQIFVMHYILHIIATRAACGGAVGVDNPENQLVKNFEPELH